MTEAAKKPGAEAENVGLRRMINEQEILALIGISSVTLWRLLKQNRFPKPSYVSANRRVRFVDQVIAWQQEVDGRGRGRRHHPTPERV